jgi:hypothetical protein
MQVLAANKLSQVGEVAIMDFPAAAELQEMRLIAAQCRAQALIARQQGGKYAAYYRVQAEHFRMLAANTRLPNAQAARLRIATSYERLAERAEAALSIRELGGEVIHRRQRPPDDAQFVRAAPQEASRAQPGDPTVSAHSANAKTQSASYEAQVAELPNDDRQIASAALVKLSRMLCEITVTLSQDTRKKLRRSPQQERFL